MLYWVNFHHPATVGEDRASHLKIFLQKSSKKLPSKNDIVFIYETEALSGALVEEKKGSRTSLFTLGRGAKAIIAKVKITSDLNRDAFIWHGTEYVGSYETEEIHTKHIAKLNEINSRYSATGLKSFNPRSYTGLRTLKAEEIEILTSLMG